MQRGCSIYIDFLALLVLLCGGAHAAAAIATGRADILLDEDGKAWLLEFTKGPAFRFSPQHMHQLHSGLCQVCCPVLSVLSGLLGWSDHC